jgi:chromate reductase
MSVPVLTVLTVVGSLQARSANAAAIRALAVRPRPDVRLVAFESLGRIPLFNPDLDGPDVDPVVTEWRAALRDAHAVLIASPEYAHSIPGVLKNALDWIVGSAELYDKPVALVSAGSTGGERALPVIAATLAAQGAQVVDSLPIPGVRPLLDTAGDLVDPAAIDALEALLATLVRSALAPD